MGDLSVRDANLVEALTTAITHKVLHLPTIRLKESVVDGTNADHARSIKYLFDLEAGVNHSDEDESEEEDE
jgi:glutamyl-tRNA reductase